MRLRKARVAALFLAGVLLNSCLQPSDLQISSPGISFNTSVEIEWTKAVKKAWEDGDQVLVFFDGCSTLEPAQGDLNYLRLIFAAGKWEPSYHESGDKVIEQFLSGRSEGKFDALFVPTQSGGVAASPYPEAPYIVKRSCLYHFCQQQGSYTVEGNVVNLSIRLSSPYDDVVQVFVEGLEQSQGTDWRLMVTDQSGKGGLTRFEGALYDPAAHSFSRHLWTQPSSKNINGYNWKGGLVFYGKACTVSGDCLTFTLEDTKAGESSRITYVKTGVGSLAGGTAIKLSYEKLASGSSYRTVLYLDGTLIIDEPESRTLENRASHGEESAVYPSFHDNEDLYTFSSSTKQIWKDKASLIKDVRFGSAVQPTDMRYWFSGCTNLSHFDPTNLDTGLCKAIGMMFAKAPSAPGVEMDLDLSSFDLSSLCGTAALQSVFQGACGLRSLDISGWRLPSGLTTCANLFNGCTSLKRIYADEGVDFSFISSSANMFKDCLSLTGGDWTCYDAQRLDKTLACIGLGNREGFFTLKGYVPQYVNPGYWETSAVTNPDSSLVGFTQSGFNVTQCIYTDDRSNQYVGFYVDEHNFIDPSDGILYPEAHEMVIAERKLPCGPWRYCRMGTAVKWDSHNYITMIKDSRGCLHVTGNMHASPLVFFSTDESGDISTLRRVTNLVGNKEASVTYPKFIRLSDGRIIFHYRDGRSGEGNEIYDILENDGKWYRFLDTPFADGQSLRNAYFIDEVKGPDGRYHLCWVWRDTSMAETNHDLMYASTSDFKNWYAANGDKLTLPVKLADTKLLVDPIPTDGGCLNGGQTIGFDSKGRPVIIYYKYDENGYTQIYGARLEDDKTWKISKLTCGTFKWEIKGGGSLTKRVSISAPQLEDDGSLTVIYNFIPESGATIRKEIWINGTTFEPVSEASPRSQPSRWDSWVNKIITPYSGNGTLSVKKAYDITGKPYMIRWEGLGSYGDRKPTDAIPQPSELRVVKLKY